MTDPGQSIIFTMARQITANKNAATKFLKYLKFDYTESLLNVITCICVHSFHSISVFEEEGILFLLNM